MPALIGQIGSNNTSQNLSMLNGNNSLVNPSPNNPFAPPHGAQVTISVFVLSFFFNN